MPIRYSGFHAPAPQQTFSPYDGLLLVDKPAGVTSHDVVYKVRKAFGIDKVGHGGTLDPGATGLLVILLGKATKVSDRVMGGDKTYTGVLRLGAETDSQDSDGDIVARGDVSTVTSEALAAAMTSLTGDIYQTPPMVSAIKKDGVRLYDLARKGKVVEREQRFVHIYEYAAIGPMVPADDGLLDVPIRVRCTKGTYIRTLCHDVGEALGCHGHLSNLRRLKSGKFDVADALPLADVLALSKEDLVGRILPLRQIQF